jgi:hypothetical protein
VAARGFKKIIPLDLAPLTSDFCNKIGTSATCCADFQYGRFPI